METHIHDSEISFAKDKSYAVNQSGDKKQNRFMNEIFDKYPQVISTEGGITKNKKEKKISKQRTNITVISGELNELDKIGQLTKDDFTNNVIQNIDSAFCSPFSNRTALVLADITKSKGDTGVKALIANTFDSIAAKKGSIRKKKIYFATGVAVQQSIRLNTQFIYPDNTYKKTPAAIDYIPSIYLRFYAKKKWFLQAEFKYAAPQYIREFVYRAVINDQPLNYITQSHVLKLIYFHQLPLSLNYKILPHWSVGAGLMYNIYYNSKTQIDVRKKMYGIANDSLIHSKIVTNGSDSGSLHFSNNISLTFETQYQWKRLSAGVRYSFGLQSYVKYTDPYLKSAEQRKVNSLNLFVRYELWRSRN